MSSSGTASSPSMGHDHAMRPPPASRPKRAGEFEGIRISRSIAVLDCFHDPDIALCIWERENDVSLTDYFTQSSLPTEFEHRLKVRCAQIRPETFLMAIPLHPMSQALASELAGLCELFASMVRCSRIGVRLVISGRRMCPRFHTDSVTARLICTWVGPGTEWVQRSDVAYSMNTSLRSGLATDERDILLPGATPHRLAPFAVGVFKGELFSDTPRSAAVHRSPSLEAGQSRAYVTLDAVS